MGATHSLQEPRAAKRARLSTGQQREEGTVLEALEPLPPPQVFMRTSDEISFDCQVSMDPHARDQRDATGYVLEARTDDHDWVIPLGCSTLTAASTATVCLARVRSQLNPGASISARVRGVRGLRAGHISPTTTTRFLDAPIRLDVVTHGSDETYEVEVDSSATITQLREAMSVPADRRLLLQSAAHDRFHGQTATAVHHQDWRGIVLDGRDDMLTMKLSDVRELRPWYHHHARYTDTVPLVAYASPSTKACNDNTSLAQIVTPPVIRVSASCKGADSVAINVFLASPSLILEAAGAPHVPSGVEDSSHSGWHPSSSFPCWVEVGASATSRDLRSALLSRTGCLLPHLEPADLRLLSSRVSATAPDGQPAGHGAGDDDDEDGEPVIKRLVAPAFGCCPHMLLAFVEPASFEVTVLDANERVAVVTVRHDTTLEQLADASGYTVQQMKGLLAHSLGEGVTGSTTLKDLRFSSLRWLLSGRDAASQVLATELTDGQPNLEVVVETYPRQISLQSKRVLVLPETKISTLQRMIECSFICLLPEHHLFIPHPSLRAADPHALIGPLLKLPERSREQEEGMIQPLVLRVMARPHDWGQTPTKDVVCDGAQ